jgi:hypothetical protein
MTGKTIDKQTLAFLTAIANNLPMMPSENMQQWIEKPAALKQLMRRCFAGGQYPDFTEENESFSKVYPMTVEPADGPIGKNLAEWALPVSCFDIYGVNPFELYDVSPELRIGLEYTALHEGKKPRIRPHLTLWDNDDDIFLQVNIPCRELFHEHRKVARVENKTILAFLSEDRGVVDAIRDMEEDYVVSIMDYWKSLTPQLRVTAFPSAWEMQLLLFKDGNVQHSFMFKISKAEVDAEFAKANEQRNALNVRRADRLEGKV